MAGSLPRCESALAAGTRTSSSVLQGEVGTGFTGVAQLQEAPPFSDPTARVMWWSWGGGLFLRREVTM